MRVYKLNDLIDNTGGGAEVSQNAAHHDQRDEVGHVADGLHQLSAGAAFNFVNHKRQQDRCRKRKHDGIQAQKQRVAQQPPAVLHLKKVDEVFKPNPFAPSDALVQVVILKGDDHFGHGAILEQNIKDQAQE